MPYQKAWVILNYKLDRKTNWGRTELRKIMLEALIEAGDPDPTIIVMENIPVQVLLKESNEQVDEANQILPWEEAEK